MNDSPFSEEKVGSNQFGGSKLIDAIIDAEGGYSNESQSTENDLFRSQDPAGSDALAILCAYGTFNPAVFIPVSLITVLRPVINRVAKQKFDSIEHLSNVEQLNFGGEVELDESFSIKDKIALLKNNYLKVASRIIKEVFNLKVASGTIKEVFKGLKEKTQSVNNFKVNPIKHLGLIYLITSLLFTKGYENLQQVEDVDVNDYNNVVNNFTNIATNSYFVDSRVPENTVIIDGDDVFLSGFSTDNSGSENSLGDISEINGHRIGRLISIGESSTQGYLIMGSITDEGSTSFSNLTHVNQIRIGVFPEIGNLIELSELLTSGETAVVVALENQPVYMNGQIPYTPIPRVFYDSINDKFFEMENLQLTTSDGSIMDPQTYQVRELTDGNWVVVYNSNPGHVSFTSNMFLRDASPINVASNPFYIEDVDVESINEVVNWIERSVDFEQSSDPLADVVRTYSSSLQYSLRPTVTNPELTSLSLETFTSQLVLDFSEGMCATGNVGLATLLSGLYANGSLDPENIDHMYYLAHGYLVFSDGSRIASINNLNNHMFGLGNNRMLDGTPSKGVSRDPYTQEFLLELARLINQSSIVVTMEDGAEYLLNYIDEADSNLEVNAPEKVKVNNTDSNYLYKLLFISIIFGGLATTGSYETYKRLSKANEVNTKNVDDFLSGDIFEKFGAKNEYEKILIYSYLKRVRFSNKKAANGLSRFDMDSNLPEDFDNAYRRISKQRRKVIEKMLQKYRLDIVKTENKHKILKEA